MGRAAVVGEVVKVEHRTNDESYAKVDGVVPRDPETKAPLGEKFTTEAHVLRLEIELGEGNYWFCPLPIAFDPDNSWGVGDEVKVTVEWE